MTLTHINPKEILSLELIRWEDLLTIMVHALYPSRKDCKGFDCVVGKYVQLPMQGNSVFPVLPMELTTEDWKYLSKYAYLFSDLRSPVSQNDSQILINEFIRVSQAQWIPRFLGAMELTEDIKRRTERFRLEFNYLKQEVSENGLTLLSGSGIPCRAFSIDMNFPRSGALKYLETRGLERLFHEPSEENIESIDLIKISFPKEQKEVPIGLSIPPALSLQSIQEYRKILIQSAELSELQKDKSLENSKSELTFDAVDKGKRTTRSKFENLNEGSVEDQLKVDKMEEDEKSMPISKNPSKEKLNSKSNSGFDVEEERYIGIDEVEKIVGVSRNTISNYLKNGEALIGDPFPRASQTGNSRRIRIWKKSEVVAWAERRFKKGLPSEIKSKRKLL